MLLANAYQRQRDQRKEVRTLLDASSSKTCSWYEIHLSLPPLQARPASRGFWWYVIKITFHVVLLELLLIEPIPEPSPLPSSALLSSLPRRLPVQGADFLGDCHSRLLLVGVDPLSDIIIVCAVNLWWLRGYEVNCSMNRLTNCINRLIDATNDRKMQSIRLDIPFIRFAGDAIVNQRCHLLFANW